MTRTFQQFLRDDFAREVHKNLCLSAQRIREAEKAQDTQALEEWSSEWEQAHNALTRRGYNVANISLTIAGGGF